MRVKKNVIASGFFALVTVLLCMGAFGKSDDPFAAMRTGVTVDDAGIDNLAEQRLLSDLQKNTDWDKGKLDTATKEWRFWRETFRAMDTSVSFYGKVVDQNGNGVAGASIKLSIASFSPIPCQTEHGPGAPMPVFQKSKGIIAKTDDSGCFQVEKERGACLDINDIAKDGYDYLPSQNMPGTFKYLPEKNKNGRPLQIDQIPIEKRSFIPNKNKPVRFLLRKKGVDAFFVCNSGSKRPVKMETLECIRWDYEHKKDIPKWPGVVVSGALTPDAGHWMLMFKGKHDGDGVLLQKDIAYEAPPDGYQPSVEVMVPASGKAKYQNIILILRTKTPVTYGIVTLEIHPDDAQDGCGISFESLLNPYGDRNLEPFAEEDLPYKVAERLTEETIAAFQQGKNPLPHADLPKLIKEARAKEKK